MWCNVLWPLLKKPTADHEHFVNFPPVSNPKYVSKVIEKAVAVQLNDYLTCNDLHVPFTPHVGVVTAQSQL